MKPNQIISITVLVLLVSFTSFFAGTKYQQKKTISNFSQQVSNREGQNIGRGNGQGMGRENNVDTTKTRGQMPGFRQTIGEIISADDKSITVKLTDGSSKIILISDSTTVNQSSPAAKSDLKVGIKVAVMGDSNTDGSVTSRNIEINPHITTVTPTAKQ